jgi:hypothetical protein
MYGPLGGPRDGLWYLRPIFLAKPEKGRPPRGEIGLYLCSKTEGLIQPRPPQLHHLLLMAQ